MYIYITFIIYIIYILYIYTCICIRIHANLPRKAMVGPSHSWSGDSRDQETFLTHSADKQPRNYNTEV